MWTIFWSIGKNSKWDSSSFDTEEKAYKYAEYYKGLLKVHSRGLHIKKRFGLCGENLKITYNLVKKKTDIEVV